MILRGAQISERRFTLPSGAATASDRAKPEPKVEAAAAVHGNPRPTVGSAPERDERALSFESVVAWLAVQNEETRKGCAAILATEITNTHETAKREGFAAGVAAGEAHAREELKHLITLLQEITANAQTAFDQEEERLEDICVDVVGEALSKIAGPLLASREATVGAIREVLLRVKEGRELIIRVAHEDFAAVRKLEEQLANVLSTRKYEIVPDSRVELGGCIVETKLGSFDGRFEVQLRELYETLRLAKLSTPELP